MTLTPSAVCVALATRAPTANMRLTPASPGPVCTGASATPPTQGFNAPAGRASLGICVRTWLTGAASHPVRMGVAVSRLGPTAFVPLGGVAACVT